MKDIGRPSDFARPYGFQAEAGTEDAFGRNDAGVGQFRSGDFGASERFGLMLDAASAQIGSTVDAAPDEADAKKPADGIGDNGAADQASAQDPENGVLLAVSMMPAFQSSMSPFEVGFLSEAAPASPHADALCDRISDHVEQAIRAEFAPVAGRPLTLDIPLSGTVPGIDGFTLTVTPGAIEVVLIVSAQTARPRATLDEAAGALADRLRTRFGKRVVRILARNADASTVEPGVKGI